MSQHGADLGDASGRESGCRPLPAALLLAAGFPWISLWVTSWLPSLIWVTACQKVARRHTTVEYGDEL